MSTKQNTYPKAIELRKKPVDDAVLAHDATYRKIHVLNTTAAAILELCDGRRNVEQINISLAQTTDIQPEIIAGDVSAILKQFRKLDVLEAS
jgi:hypothetical protein